ncbi:MAG: NADH-quinone oxidoreductase subunit M, partial [Rickettsiales bacterium]|nr:NADH-quinone oxidoreductase subunit M [Rickettsiales bacterium]
IVYTSLVALVQTDIKKLIAYSSIAHMGFVTIGIFAFNKQAIEGAVFQMISHGLISAALFLCVGVIYDRMRTREIVKYGGLVNRMPKYAVIFIFFSMASIGLPGTSGFVGEFLVIVGVFQASKIFAAIASLGIILGACYMLWLCSRVIFGSLKRSELKNILDLNRNEMFVLIPLLVFTLLLGVYPSIITDALNVSVDQLISQVTSKQDVELALKSL